MSRAHRPCCVASTGWKRRSRAASFSMYCRYSVRVVAPMHCSSPRARAGLRMLAASMAPSAAPAPTSVCSSSMKRIVSLLWVTSSTTFFRRSSNSPRYLVRDVRGCKGAYGGVRGCTRGVQGGCKGGARRCMCMCMCMWGARGALLEVASSTWCPRRACRARARSAACP